MTRFRLGINNCFAVKRWPEADAWADLVANDLGLDLVQHSFDLSDLNTSDDDVAADADAVRGACGARGIQIDSTFTGLAAYSSNLLLSPSERGRAQAMAWYQRAISFTAQLGVKRTGGHIGAYSVRDWNDETRRAALHSRLLGDLDELLASASAAGLDQLLVENLAAAREPSTMADISALLRDSDSSHAALRLCLDVGHQCVPGTAGDDRDPYAWLTRMGRMSPVVQLQQSDALADHHWPFTEEHNSNGRIEAIRVLEALEHSGVEDVALILEIVPTFEADDNDVRRDLIASAAYWR